VHLPKEKVYIAKRETMKMKTELSDQSGRSLHLLIIEANLYVSYLRWFTQSS